MSIRFEQDCYDHIKQTVRVDELLLARRTAWQEMTLFRNRFLGTVLTLDGVIQLTGRDEFVYSEMLAHVPLCLHPAPRRVLIVGGGDLLVLEEVLKHPCVERAVLVDLDGEVVEACKLHLRDLHRDTWRDPRVEIRIGDGAAFAATTAERFDVILSDGPDPLGAGAAGCPLYTPEYFAACAKILDEGGIFVTQNDVPFYHGAAMRTTWAAMAALPHRRAYLCAVPTFDGGFNAMILGSRAPIQAERAIRMPPPGLGYYTAEMHRASFVLPPFIHRMIIDG